MNSPFYLFLVVDVRGKYQTLLPLGNSLKFLADSSPVQLRGNEIKKKTNRRMDLKVYRQLAFLASDENGRPERQIWVDSHGGMKIAPRIHLPGPFQRHGRHAVHPSIRGLVTVETSRGVSNDGHPVPTQMCESLMSPALIYNRLC